MTLNLDPQISILMEWVFGIEDEFRKKEYISSDSGNGSYLLPLIWLTIKNFEIRNTRYLSIIFNSGLILYLHDNNLNTESFSITSPNTNIII